MTFYYICRADGLTDLELSQTQEERLACEILKAACIYDEIRTDLLAVPADSENGSYAQLKGAALYSLELTSSNIELWENYGRKIFLYLLAPEDDCSQLWAAYYSLSLAISEYEELCANSSVFEDLADGFADSIEVHLDENIREEQSSFATIMEDVYKIEELKLVST